MARIRTIKPEFWQHPKVGAVSRDARLLFLGLLNEADDEGRLRYGTKRLAGVIFGEDDDVGPGEIDAWTSELEREQLVVRYHIDGGEYLALLGFTEHQKINRPTPSRLPAPPCSEPSLNAHGALTEPSLLERKGKEKEQGKEIALDERANEPAARKRDPIFDALVDCWQIDPREFTEDERKRVNTAAGKLRAIDADPSEIPARRAMYAMLFPTAAQTMMALVNRWAECRPDAARIPQQAGRSTATIARTIARAT